MFQHFQIFFGNSRYSFIYNLQQRQYSYWTYNRRDDGSNWVKNRYIYISFWSRPKKSNKTAIYQPSILLFVITPLNSFKMTTHFHRFWLHYIRFRDSMRAILVDRSGRPYIQSTFSLLQAFMSPGQKIKLKLKRF